MRFRDGEGGYADTERAILELLERDDDVPAPLRPEDDQRGEIYQGTGELGFFSPHSWWPLFVGTSAALAAVGVAIGWWMFLIGMLAVILSVIGFVFEYYRGHYAH